MRSCCLIDKTHAVKRFHLLWSSGHHCALQYIYIKRNYSADSCSALWKLQPSWQSPSSPPSTPGIISLDSNFPVLIFFFFKSNYIQKSIACGRQCFVSSNPTGNRWKTTENRAWKKPSNISSCPCSDVLHTHLLMCKADLNVIFPNYSCKGT